MNSEKAKQSKNNQGDLLRAGCQAISLVIALFIVLYFIIAVASGILIFVFTFAGNLHFFYKFSISSVTLFLLLVSCIGFFYIAGKNAEYFRTQVTHYRRIRDERKRIEHLMAQNKVKTIAEIDNLEYPAEVEKYKQSR